MEIVTHEPAQTTLLGFTAARSGRVDHSVFARSLYLDLVRLFSREKEIPSAIFMLIIMPGLRRKNTEGAS